MEQRASAPRLHCKIWTEVRPSLDPTAEVILACLSHHPQSPPSTPPSCLVRPLVSGTTTFLELATLHGGLSVRAEYGHSIPGEVVLGLSGRKHFAYRLPLWKTPRDMASSLRPSSSQEHLSRQGRIRLASNVAPEEASRGVHQACRCC